MTLAANSALVAVRIYCGKDQHKVLVAGWHVF
jgi:hypothetical protein